MLKCDYSLLEYKPYALKHTGLKLDRVRNQRGEEISDYDLFITKVESTYHSTMRKVLEALVGLGRIYKDCFKNTDPVDLTLLSSFQEYVLKLCELGCLKETPKVPLGITGIELRKVVKSIEKEILPEEEFYKTLLTHTETMYLKENSLHAKEVVESKVLSQLEEFNKYFTSENGCPRDSHIKVSRTEWEVLYNLLKETI